MLTEFVLENLKRRGLEVIDIVQGIILNRILKM
jgi:hypothetical protein